MHVREAEAADLEAVLQLLSEDAIRPFQEPAEVSEHQRAAMAEIVDSPMHTLLVGEVDGEIVATAQLTWLRVLIYDGGILCQIEAVRTASAHRGRGLGSELIRYAIELARRGGCARVQLTTNAQRTRAREFYGRLGFEPTHIGMKLHLETR